MEDSAREDAAPGRPSGFLGTDLHVWVITAIILVTSVVFVFWGGALWRAPRGATHLGRIAVSYLLAAPLVAAALIARRRWSWGRFFSGIVVVWSAKLVITSSLYALIAPGSASSYAPTDSWETTKPAATTTPAPIDTSTAGATGAIAGTIVDHGKPVTDAAVVIEGVTSGGAPARDVEIAVDHAAYAHTIVLTTPSSKITVVNHDAVLHTLRITQQGNAVLNVPVPAGKTSSIVAPDAGVYDVSCENHATEHARLVVVDHPFASLTDADGRFEIAGLPAGARTIVVLRDGQPPRRREVQVEAGGRAVLSFDLEGEPK